MSEKIFTASEFADKCAALARDFNTVYALGMWGWKLTREGIDAKARQLPSFYTEAKKRELYALADKGGYWGFDCVCMIKALLWGWGSNLTSNRGGAVYASNGVPDFGADGIERYCTGYSTDFSHVKVGEALRMPGHVGVYVGGGLAVECTAAWEGKVIITAVGNIGKVAGYHTRTWTHHGMLKWINYEEDEMTPVEKKRLEDLEKKNADLEKKVAALEKTVAEFEKNAADYAEPLEVFHYWKDIEKRLPWAYKPLRALYNAGLFKGESAKDLRVRRLKIECLVALAAALKKIGELDY